jgi:uncharacterized protein
MNAQHRILTGGVALISRVLILRDRFLRRVARPQQIDTQISVTRNDIPSGHNRIATVFVTPNPKDVKANVLLCHGIGETVEHWFAVQQLLAGGGVASLVFNYSGFGRSTGRFTAHQAEQDAISAFHHMRKLATPLPISVLGLSLGSGIAAAIAPRVEAHRLVLCAPFTSLRKGAVSIALPKSLRALVPDIWDSETTLRACTIPVLIVHGDRDRLFPVRMAEELKAACAAPCELIIIPGLGHNSPFAHPHIDYWGLIVSRLIQPR